MYCSNCGVELESHRDRCPLCRGQDLTEDLVTVPEYSPLPEDTGMPPVQRVYFRLVTLLSATAGVVVLIVDVGSGGGAGWSPVVLYALGTAWILTAVPALGVRFRYLFLLDVAAITALLYGVAYHTGGVNTWFPDLALPITAVVALVAAVLVGAIRRAGGVVRLSVVLAAAGAVCVGIDLVISSYLGQPVRPGWSTVVLVSVVPAAVFLLLLQKTVLRYIDLRRRFHL